MISRCSPPTHTHILSHSLPDGTHIHPTASASKCMHLMRREEWARPSLDRQTAASSSLFWPFPQTFYPRLLTSETVLKPIRQEVPSSGSTLAAPCPFRTISQPDQSGHLASHGQVPSTPIARVKVMDEKEQVENTEGQSSRSKSRLHVPSSSLKEYLPCVGS
ncbi:hypothetical protein BDP81DRAFT_419248 [Colletotrichum phormii]|uniref:Uncharacterized protein n=1 Tax=Colletotrichum phormii TaxID=359342 RepID=A0AAI9ZY81_9PEZI|nr:uncharacterized protein BDP81DRAFT_419248 [Colletotrichum phormii]KAK1640041.1 hypothetical protein BDP81DRAFT_419248 [Colletotrichum phormii]